MYIIAVFSESGKQTKTNKSPQFESETGIAISRQSVPQSTSGFVRRYSPDSAQGMGPSNSTGCTLPQILEFSCSIAL